MTDPALEKKYKGLLPLMWRAMDLSTEDTAREASIAVNMILKRWQAEPAIVLSDFIEWLHVQDAFIDNQKKVNAEQIKALLVNLSERINFLFPDEEGAMAIAVSITNHYITEKASAERNRKRPVLLDIVRLRKKAEKFRSENQLRMAERFEQEARQIAEKNSISPREFDFFHLRREQAILELYQQITLVESISNPEELQARHAEIGEKSVYWGLADVQQGELNYHPEFQDTYAVYCNDPELYETAIEDLAKAYATNYPKYADQAQARSGQQKSDAADDGVDLDGDSEEAGATVTTRPRPDYITVFPVRDYEGHVMAHIGAVDYRAAVTKLVLNQGDVSLSQDFGLNRVSIAGKGKVSIRQNGVVAGWHVAAEEIVWTVAEKAEKSENSLEDTTFEAASAKIDLDVSRGVKISVTDDGSVAVIGATHDATIVFAQKGRFVVGSLFENSSFTANTADTAFEFSDGARAINSRFTGQLPAVSRLRDRVILGEFTKLRAHEVFWGIEDLLQSVLSLGYEGYYTNPFTSTVDKGHAYYRPALVRLTSSDELMVKYFIYALDSGLQGQSLKIPAGLFRRGGDLKKAKPFFDRIQSSGNGVSIVVEPILNKPAGFPLMGADTANPEQFTYRIVLFAGYQMSTSDIGAILVTPVGGSVLSDGSETSKIESFIAAHGGYSFSFIIEAKPVSKRATQVGLTRIGAAQLRLLSEVYTQIKTMGLAKPFSDTSYLNYTYTTENYGVQRAAYQSSGVNSPLDPSYYAHNANDLHNVYDTTVKRLTEYLPVRIPAMLSGQYFQTCAFTGQFDEAILDSMAGNRFIKFSGTKMTVTGDWTAAEFEEATLDASTSEAVQLEKVIMSSSMINLTGDGQSDIAADNIVVKDTDLTVRDYLTFSARNGTFRHKIVSFVNVGSVELGHAVFEGCTLVFKNAAKVNASDARFTDCQITFEAGDLPAVQVTREKKLSDAIPDPKALIKTASKETFWSDQDNSQGLIGLVHRYLDNAEDLELVRRGIQDGEKRLAKISIQQLQVMRKALARAIPVEVYDYLFNSGASPAAINFKNGASPAAINIKINGPVSDAFEHRVIVLDRALFLNSTLHISGDNLSMKEVKLTGASHIKGSTGCLDVSGAQLGSDAGMLADTTWELVAREARLDSCQLGNITITSGSAFGDDPHRHPWETVSLIGAPSIMPDAQALFPLLKRARNYAQAVEPLASDPGAQSALVFTL